jgi:xanthine dehydrogenase accessory factor
VYEIALSVAACLRAGTRVDVAWVVDAEGLDQRDRAEALAITPGGGRVGPLLSGAIDPQLADLAGPGIGRGRLVEVEVGDVDALVAGLPSGGRARCLLVPAAELPGELWDLLTARAPVCLVTHVDGDEVVETTLRPITRSHDGEGERGGLDDQVERMAAARVSGTAVMGDAVVTVLWPVSRLVVVGAGAVADALADAATLLGWRVQLAGDAATASGLIAGLSALDEVVVASHDLELGGRALAAALDTDVGYIGALGGRRAQQARADWLAYRGITDLERVHGPAGLDIGAETPAEIAVAILAEAVAVRSSARDPQRRSPASPRTLVEGSQRDTRTGGMVVDDPRG